MPITTTGAPAELAQLYAKIARVTAAMKRVPKNSTNTHQGYKYANEGDIMDALRAAMGDANLAIMPSVDAIERIAPTNERLGPITRLLMTYAVVCGDTGASVHLQWIGEGQDTGDKAVYKAYTGAEKYFLMKLFLVATGDDPEQDEPQPRQPEPTRRQAPTQAQQTINQNMKPKISTEEAEQRFWTKYSPVLGAADWGLVQKLLDTDEATPTTAGAWINAARAVETALKSETTQAA